MTYVTFGTNLTFSGPKTPSGDFEEGQTSFITFWIIILLRSAGSIFESPSTFVLSTRALRA
jgi:hypothetical protein